MGGAADCDAEVERPGWGSDVTRDEQCSMGVSLGASREGRASGSDRGDNGREHVTSFVHLQRDRQDNKTSDLGP